MTERKIQTEAYWRSEFVVSDEDITFLNELFLEEHRPLTIAEMTRALITDYCQREEMLIRRQLAKGTVYRPNASFEIGETLVFPHLAFSVGKVVDQRAGRNPEHQDFAVISVEFDESRDGKREFAAELTEPHKLAFPDESSWESVFAISPDMLLDSYGGVVADRLQEHLRTDGNFAEFRSLWFPTAMAADVHIGLLNIAEAMLVVQERPLAPEELLSELDLPAEIPESVKVFSLNCVIAQDDRFQDVGDEEQVVWGVKRWLPEEALAVPPRLLYEEATYDRTKLDVTHLQLEREIDDEASHLVAPPTAAAAADAVMLLTHPHWRHGTLPLTDRTRVFFPPGAAEQCTRITFLDRVSQTQFTGYVVHEHGYVCGLGEWYRANNVPVGAYIKLERTGDRSTVAVDLVPRRMQRQWTRMIAANAEGELSFLMQKRPIACEYDEFCLLDEPDRSVGDTLWLQEQGRDRELLDLTTSVFLELAKLTPSVTVHAKTLYAAVNVIRRCPPGRVFATLFSVPEFVTTGDGYWIYQGGG